MLIGPATKKFKLLFFFLKCFAISRYSKIPFSLIIRPKKIKFFLIFPLFFVLNLEIPSVGIKLTFFFKYFEKNDLSSGLIHIILSILLKINLKIERINSLKFLC